MNYSFSPVQGVRVLLVLMLSLFCAANLATAKANVYEEIDWLELMPQEDVDALTKMAELPVDHNMAGKQVGSFKTVPIMNNKKVRIAGYMVPVTQNEDGSVSEFFFVPYFGACVHVPPPPPNNIIFVKIKRAVEADMFNAFWLEGTLKIQRFSNATADTAYIMDADSLKFYE